MLLKVAHDWELFMAAWRLTRFAAMCCVLLLPSTAAAGDIRDLPEPNLAAIAWMARKSNPDLPYVVSLPDRRKECKAAAMPYLSSPNTLHSVWATLILRECYKAMLIRMAELYYKPDAFGSGGMPALLDRLQRDLEDLYRDVYEGRADCKVDCGSITYTLLYSDSVTPIEEAVRTMALLQSHIADRQQWIEAWKVAGWGH